MADKVVRLGIARDRRYLYYVGADEVFRVPNKQSGLPHTREKLREHGVTLDRGQYLYFVDSEGDLAREKRSVGGQLRKSRVRTKKTAALRAPGQTIKTVRRSTAAKSSRAPTRGGSKSRRGKTSSR